MWFVRSRKPRVSRKARRIPSSFRPRIEPLEDRCLLSAPLPTAPLPTAGTLDPTFGNGAGYVTTSTSTTADPDNGFDVVVQPSGKVVVSGWSGVVNSSGQYSTAGFGLAEFDPNGNLDPNFGSGGTVHASFSNSYQTGGYDAILYPTGRSGDEQIVLVGESVSNGGVLAVERFNADGSLDTHFAGGGLATTPQKYSAGPAYAVALEPNGTSLPKIVVAGAGPQSQIELARFNPNGSLDKTFGSQGIVLTANTRGIWDEIAFDPVNGDLIVTASSNNQVIVAAYTTSGALDSSFGNQGLAINTASTGAGRAVAIQSDGKIVVSGGGIIARYNPNGTLDPTFGSGGEIAGGGTDLAIQSNGQILCDGGGSLVRYNTDGILDATFGTGGTVTMPMLSRGMAIAPNGDIVVQQGQVGQDFGAARFLPSDPEISSFTASPTPVPAGTSTTLTAANITDANPNATITQVAFYYIDNSGNPQLLGYGTQGSGVWSFSFTVNLASGSYTLLAQAEDSYGVFGDAAAITLTVQ